MLNFPLPLLLRDVFCLQAVNINRERSIVMNTQITDKGKCLMKTTVTNLETFFCKGISSLLLLMTYDTLSHIDSPI